MLDVTDRRLQLDNEGYCTVAGVLSEPMLHTLQKRFDAFELQKTSRSNFGESGGFVELSYEDPTIAEVLSWPITLEALAALDFPHPKLHSFYVSAKPPKSEALAWHSDLFYDYNAVNPAELFLIYYLQDTAPGNGCLRVVPGSHLDPKTKQEPVDVPLKAGDLFIGDRRILHATYANASDEWRTCITIAYAPVFDELPESVQAMIVNNRCLPPKGWDVDPKVQINPRLAAILPIYRGTAKLINEQ
ncbi:MAG: hypothetical protein JWN01_400 [Patescibacteria group bacterium]|nr:hypothetical protein [Patescibacteria group bacterium]